MSAPGSAGREGSSAVAGGLVSMALLGLLAWATRAPVLTPPLGATALLCFQSPTAPASSPRSVVCGHALGLLCGWLALLATGTLGQPATLTELSLARVIGVALALAATMLLMNAWNCLHPPAGATPLVVALGLLQEPIELAALMGGAIVVAGFALAWHRARGVDYPFWSPRRP